MDTYTTKETLVTVSEGDLLEISITGPEESPYCNLEYGTGNDASHISLQNATASHASHSSLLNTQQHLLARWICLGL